MPVVVPSAFAMVFLLSCGSGDSSSNEAVPDVTPSSTTGSDAADDASVPAVTTAPASETSVLAPVVESTVASTVAPTTVAPTTTASAEAPVVTAREPVALDPGDPATCEVRVGSGGAFSVVTDVASGFDVAFAQALVERVYGTTNICFIPLGAAERWTALDDGTVDLLVRNTHATTSRDEQADFTRGYLLDGFGVVVRRDVEITNDLAGLSVAVPPWNSDLVSDNTSAEPVLYEDFPMAAAAFESGETDALAGHWTEVESNGVVYRLSPDGYLFRAFDLPLEPIAVFVREGNVELRNRLDKGIESLFDDGTWEAIRRAEFPGLPPWHESTAAAVMNAPPIDR